MIHFANEFHMGLVKFTKQFTGQKLSALALDDTDTTMYWLYRQLYNQSKHHCPSDWFYANPIVSRGSFVRSCRPKLNLSLFKVWLCVAVVGWKTWEQTVKAAAATVNTRVWPLLKRG